MGSPERSDFNLHALWNSKGKGKGKQVERYCSDAKNVRPCFLSYQSQNRPSSVFQNVQLTSIYTITGV